MKIGILILHYNTPELTAKLCHMVPKAIVIDNGSMIPFSGVSNQVIRFESNLGFTPNWNRALMHMMETTDFQAFWMMNSDIVINQSSVDRIEEVMDDPKIAMVTPSYNCWIPACRNLNTNSIREVKCIEFTAPVIRRSTLEKIGFFDEVFVRGYGVELDYALRMKKSGLKLFCDDGSSFEHLGQRTINGHEGIKAYEKAAVTELNFGMSKKYGSNWKPMVIKTIDVFKLSKKQRPMKIAIYTTIFNQYAKLFPVPKQTVPADLFCITDDKCPEVLPVKENSEPTYTMIQVQTPRGDLHPRMRAKFFKLFPNECRELRKYDYTIFIDGSIEIISPEFVRHCIDRMGHNDMVLYKHPSRDCIYEEAAASYPLKKYKGENIKGQIEEYRSLYPAHGGLYACGVMVRRMSSMRIREIMGHWWWECIKWSYQDQISLPVVCRIARFQPATFEESQAKNEYFKIHWHDDKTAGDNK